MNLEISDEERRALIWHEGDTFELLSGIFCVTRSTQSQLEQQAGHRYVHFLFELADTGELLSGDMTLSSEIPNGLTLGLFLKRGETLCPYAWISMVNRAWCYTPCFENIPFYEGTERYKRFIEPPIVSAIGPPARLWWAIWKVLFTDCEAEGLEFINTLHRFLHRIASNHTFYWKEGGGETTEDRL